MKNARNEKLRINPQAICIAVLALLLAACIVFIGVLSANMTSPLGPNSAGATDVAADNPADGNLQKAEIKVQNLVLAQSTAAVTRQPVRSAKRLPHMFIRKTPRTKLWTGRSSGWIRKRRKISRSI